MARRARPPDSRAFKAKVALAAIKGEKTLADLAQQYDGITEATDPSQRMFGDGHVAACLGRARVPGTMLLRQLLAEVRAFENGAAQSDDIAAIVLTIDGKTYP